MNPSNSRALRAATLVAAVAVPLLSALPARAWDAQTHESIVRLALALSPAAEARVTGNYDSFYAAVMEPDAYDRNCHGHPALPPPRDPATVAGQLLDQIQGGKMMPSANLRAQLIGRLLHYVADCAVPDVMASDDSFTPGAFWSQSTFAVFRQSRPLTKPYAEAFRRLGAEARWGDENRSAHTYAYRVAVNLVVDTLLAIPAPQATAADKGPVIFGVDRVDNGMASSAKNTSYWWGYGNNTYYGGNTSAGAYTKGYTSTTQSSAAMVKPPTDTEALHLLEWVTRRSGSEVQVRALLYNNDDLCAGQITISDGSWRADVTGGIAPRSLRSIELTMPATVAVDRLRPIWRSTKCSAPFAAEMGVSAAQRAILNAAGRPPRVDDRVDEVMIGK
ncbi:MAG TPA: zinc dependent phospholipase C family protein [Thermoanaerobaculia bacterium]|nr:zinc dependent phospholipase C family protein [Thermoanaerobaculia bacterium]